MKTIVFIIKYLYCTNYNVPTGALDKNTGIEIINIIKEINKKNHKTVVIVTHDEKIASEADMIVRIEDGKIKD